MSTNPLDPEVPPAGEEIHLPGPTLQPLLLTLGITLGLVGATTSLVLVIVGAVLTIAVMIHWIADTRRDIEALPLEHHH